jgi:anthranilate phosphoribosyltransferase
VLTALGVKIGISPEAIQRCVREAGIGFMMATTHHASMRHVGAARVELGTRTIFNLLGPLSNPAGVKRQLMGVFAANFIAPLAEVLKELGSEKAWLVHGDDGLDELTTTAATHVAILDGGKVTASDVTPEEIGLARVPLSALKGGDTPENAAALRRLLDGERGPFRDIVLLNAAAALIVAGKAQNLKDGAALAAEALDRGAAKDVLAHVVALSQKVAP